MVEDVVELIEGAAPGVAIGERPAESTLMGSALILVGIVLRQSPETPMLVKADRNVPYGNVVGAMVVLQQAGADAVACVHADGQYAPEQLDHLVDVMRWRRLFPAIAIWSRRHAIVVAPASFLVAPQKTEVSPSTSPVSSFSPACSASSRRSATRSPA